MEFFKQVRILNFNAAAYTCYERLLRENKQLNKKRLNKATESELDDNERVRIR